MPTPVDCEIVGSAIVPRYLTERDDPWVRALLFAYESLAGMPFDEASASLAREVTAMIQRGVRAPPLHGMRALLDRIFVTAPHVVAKPRDVRRALYEAAQRKREQDAVRPRAEVLSSVASVFGVLPSAVLHAAFADFSEARELARPDDVPTVRGLCERYNLALVQALLAQSTALDVLVRENVASVVRFAKLKRLLCTFDDDPVGTRIEMSGPLALFGPTTKYGRAFAAFVPHVVSTAGFSIEASCRVRGVSSKLRVSHADPIHRAHALPRDYDSELERRLARALRRLRSRWSVHREAGPLRSATGLVFPDFTLRAGDEHVHVELVGFWTPEYLERKMRDLRTVRAPLVVCVDATRSLPADAFAPHEVVKYSKDVDVNRLLAAVERAAGRSGCIRKS